MNHPHHEVGCLMPSKMVNMFIKSLSASVQGIFHVSHKRQGFVKPTISQPVKQRLFKEGVPQLARKLSIGYLGGGFKYLLFSPLFVEMIHFEEHNFQMG